MREKEMDFRSVLRTVVESGRKRRRRGGEEEYEPFMKYWASAVERLELTASSQFRHEAISLITLLVQESWISCGVKVVVSPDC
jgi:hypothetical protein